MGWDVTFHPVSERDLQRFVFDILDNPSLLDARLAELCSDPAARQAMRTIYDANLRLVDEELGDGRYAATRVRGAAQGEDEEDLEAAACDVRGLAATVAGCRHPYWYARNAALQFARDDSLSVMFRPMAEIGTGRVRNIESAQETHFSGNFEGSGFIRPADVRTIAARIDAGDPLLLETFGGRESNEWESLRLAVAYAKDRGLGLIEATDLMMIGGVIYAPEPNNLRAHYLKNVHIDTDTGTGTRTDINTSTHIYADADADTSMYADLNTPDKFNPGMSRVLVPAVVIGALIVLNVLYYLARHGDISYTVFGLAVVVMAVIVPILVREIQSRFD